MQDTRVRSLGWEDPLEKEMATHSSTVAWRIPWREEPGRLQSMGSQRVGHDWATSLTLNLISVSRSLFSSIFVCFLDSKYEWKNTVFVFLFLTYISLNTLKIHSCCNKVQNFILSYGWGVSLCVCVCVAHHIPFIYSSISGHLRGLCILTIVKSVAMNIGVHYPFQMFFKCFSNK